MSQAQRDFAAVKALPKFEEAAKVRQQQHGGTAPGSAKNTQALTTPECLGRAVDHLAKVLALWLS
jgi:hypothetical protein